jgi:hypothetical protein
MLQAGDPDHTNDYARSFGMYQGDPATGRGKTRRGTITRGNTKAMRTHSTKGTTSSRPHKPGGGALAAAGKDRLAGVLDQLRGGNLGGVLGTALLGTGKKLAGLGGGKRRRSMNFTNVRALKRGLRRVEGFEKLVHRVQKAYPRLKHATHAGSAPRTHHFGRKGK